MSHRHRGFCQGHSSKKDKGFNYSNESSSSGTTAYHEEDRPPPGLRGKEIGLWYKNRHVSKQAKKTKQDSIIKLKQQTEEDITQLIETPKSSFDKSCDIRHTAADSSSFEDRYSHINDTYFKKKFLSIVSGNFEDNLKKAFLSKSRLVRDEKLDIRLLDELNQQKTRKQYASMLEFRQKLPSYEKRDEILDLIKANQVVVISGETGCGKTTQVAQFILDYEIEHGRGSTTCIACTQPRRISAISVAERVASERADRLGNSIGYHIRLEKVLPRTQGSIVFCTTAMLLQFMQMDPALKNYSHIILDEIHERSTQSDFIITLLKQVLPMRPDLKVILMSATLNSKQFSKYYNDCPMMHIPGFTYPVEEFYLEDVLSVVRYQYPQNAQHDAPWNKKHTKKHKKQKDIQNKFQDFIGPYIRHLQFQKKYPDHVLEQLRNPKSEELSLELILELTKYICITKGPGAILIFLPGLQDISKLNRMMLDCGSFPRDRFFIYPLHSRMPTADQKRIFCVPPFGTRKIIISTIIAETSITIEDVVYVIDCGKTKMSNFDTENNLQTLEPEWVSAANALQRKGRAGRVQPGVCYHLFTQARANELNKYPLPEMLRTRLEEVILQIKILQIGKAETFLMSLMDPPNPNAISLSLQLLRQLNALDEKEDLTPLGYHLAHLPLDPRTGKMLIWAAMFSCIDPVFSIAASLSFKDAFYCPLEKEDLARKKKLELSDNQFSDHIALAEALKRYEEKKYSGEAYQFCREYFLSWNTLKQLSEMKQQFAKYLCEMKFLRNDNPKDPNANINSYKKSLVKAIVCAGLYPNVAIIKGCTRSGVKAITTERELVKLHPASVNEKQRSFPSPYVTYYLKRKSTGIYLFDTTCVTPLALIFASPNSSIGKRDKMSVISIAGNLSFQCESRTAQIVQKLHNSLDSILEDKINDPGTVNWLAHEGNILKAIIELLLESDEKMGVDSGRYHTWEDFDEDSIDWSQYD